MRICRGGEHDHFFAAHVKESGRVYEIEQHVRRGRLTRTWVNGMRLWRFALRHPWDGLRLFMLGRMLLVHWKAVAG